ncbi:MAG: membrane protein insertion efficiency factor YidD [Endomicrobia bacterium]|nr:membrane protein insertion efficiency factor YidD [Endomicrobiia bacterium]
MRIFIIFLFILINKNIFSEESKNIIQGLFISAIRAYQKYISPFNLNVCRFSPSCSNYGYEAIRKYDFFIGGLMTADRLLRCHMWGEFGEDPVDKHYIFASYKEKNFESIFNYDFREDIDYSDKFLFGNKLFEEGLYEQAVIEYKRILYEKENFLSEEEKFFCRYRIGLSFYKLKKYQNALDIFNELSEEASLEFKLRSTFMSGCAYYRLGLNSLAQNKFNEIYKNYPTHQIAKKAAMFLSLIYIDEEDWQKAKNQLILINEKFPSTSEAEKAQVLYKKILDLDKIPKKSLILGGVLSIIPGLGKIYAGRLNDGLFSLFYISAIGYLSYESFKNNFYFLGGLTSFFTISFYFGNIYGSIDAVRQYNRSQNIRFKQYLKQTIELDLYNF